ncbi:MAG: hypothetical protein QOF58_2912 [Pseudonocardiales bacterium]|nr:hypothetical protein [Pseudonocardiales bacterium]
MTTCDVRAAVEAFYQARAAMMKDFRARTASDVVSAVLTGSMPRQGNCANGWGYFVHGVGYTVVLPSEAQLHIDAGKDVDVISVFDLRFYLEGIGCGALELAAIREQCEALVVEGLLGELDGTNFELISTM